MSPEAWIPITLAAAFLQNIRSYLQRRLTGVLTVHGAAYVRFLYALPFAWLYALLVVDEPLAAVSNVDFWAYCGVGALSQIAATACLLASFSGGQFSVGTVLSKTEAAQAALFGALLLGDRVNASMAAGIGVSFAGVIILSGRMRVDQLKGRTLFLGIAAGSMFGIAAVGFRGAALSTSTPNTFEAAAITLAIAVTLQTVVYGVFLAVREPSSTATVLHHWRAGSLVGMSGMAASACWFTAMAMVSAALVRTLGQVELLFTLATSAWLLREKIGIREILGAVLVAGGLLLVTLAPI
jgi:drug/metabolite transporter (DMT)-like permease